MIQNAIVEVIMTGGKARVRPLNLQGFVRFPRHLRQVGNKYMVAELKEGKSGSWIASGNIQRVY